MRGLSVLLALVSLVPLPATADDYQGLSAGYQFAGIPTFAMGSTFSDAAAVMAHGGSIEYVLGDDETRWYLGLVAAGLTMEDTYWRLQGATVDQAVFAEFDLVFAGISATHSWRIPLADGLTFIPSIGGGIMAVFGDMYATELVPGCTGNLSQCGHWNSVTRHPVRLTSRVLPLVIATVGLQYNLWQGSAVTLSTGVMNLPFVGLSFQQELDL